MRDESDLVEGLYDAALGYRSWGEICHAVRELVGGETLMMSTHHARRGEVDVLGWLNMSQDAMADYAHFAPHDLWHTGYVAQSCFGQAMVGTQVVPERELERSFIYNEYLQPKVGIHHLVGAVVEMDGGYQAALGIHRPRDAAAFSLDESARLTRLLPHLQRALEVRRRLLEADRARHSAHAVLDRLNLGVVMMTGSGRLLHVNAAADAILGSADGLRRTPDGLRAAHKDDDRRLQELIGGLRCRTGENRSAGGHMLVRRPSGRHAYGVMLAPVGPRALGEAGDAVAMVAFISDPGEKIVSDLSVLSELFGFTPAEARLVLALLSGIALPDFARQTGVTYNTVRTLLARAMARTEARSQLELVLLVAGSIGATGRRPSPP